MPVSATIVIPNYNKGEFLRHSLDSVLRQTVNDWEAIVVDDASMDDSWRIAREYAEKDARIVAIRNDVNMGGCYCRNRGAKLAHGKYLIFLDSDDWLVNDCLEMRMHEFEKDDNRDIGMLIFEMMTTEDGQHGRLWTLGNRQKALISFLRHSMPWTIMMPIWRREAFERVGGFDESFPRLQDVELHTRALLQGVAYRFAERKTPDCLYFVDNSRMTMNHEAMARKFAKATLQYVEKMAGLVRTGVERMSLNESLMAAIRCIGDDYWSGRIDRNLRDVLYGDILGGDRTSNWVRFYAWSYLRGLNKIHGFNYLFRKIYRIF